MKPFVITVVLSLVGASSFGAEQRFDHRGAVGLLLAGTIERRDSSTTQGFNDGGPAYAWRGAGELGGTYAVGGDGNELKVSIRALFGGPPLRNKLNVDTSLLTGYRGYFDMGQWKTFVDLDVATHFSPVFTIGPRIGLGVQLDFLPVAGAFAALGAQIGFGDGIRYGAELMIGFQLRSYLLE